MESLVSSEQSENACDLMLHYARTAEQQYLNALVRQHGRSLYYFLLRQCQADLAADLCQQSWLRVMEARLQFQGQSSFKTWLFSIARHLLQDEIRRRQRWRWFTEPVELVAPEQPELQVQQAQLQQQFNAALRALPLVQREAILLQLEGFSLAEISQICQTGQETIKSRLRYARAAMAAGLGVDDE